MKKNLLTGIQAVKDVLDGTLEEDPRAGMKANAERVLADSDALVLAKNLMAKSKTNSKYQKEIQCQIKIEI